MTSPLDNCEGCSNFTGARCENVQTFQESREQLREIHNIGAVTLLRARDVAVGVMQVQQTSDPEMALRNVQFTDAAGTYDSTGNVYGMLLDEYSGSQMQELVDKMSNAAMAVGDCRATSPVPDANI